MRVLGSVTAIELREVEINYMCFHKRINLNNTLRYYLILCVFLHNLSVFLTRTRTQAVNVRLLRTHVFSSL